MSTNLFRAKMGRSVLLTKREAEKVEAFLDWLLDPAMFAARAPEPRAPVRTLLDRAIRLIRGAQTHMRDFRLVRAAEDLCAVQEEIAKGGAFATFTNNSASLTAPRPFGNIDEGQRLAVAVTVAGKLRPKESPYAAVTAHLERKGNSRDVKAVEMRVRRFEKLIGGRERLRGFAETLYGQFKLTKRRTRRKWLPHFTRSETRLFQKLFGRAGEA